MNRQDRTTSPAVPGIDRSDDRCAHGAAGSVSYSGDEWADYRTYTPDEAAAELVARGVPPDHAPELVDRYLDGLSCERGWSPQDQWEIDDDDIAVMLADPTPAVVGEDEEATFVPTDAELDQMRARVQDAREHGHFWQPAAAQMQWRERDVPGEDGRRWELRDVTDEPSAVADSYGSVYGTGYDSWQRHNDPGGCRGLTGAAGPPIDAGPALTGEEAAHELAADGRPLDEARAMVRGYLDDASERVGTSVHLWGLDAADLAAMRADPIERARTAAAVLDVASEAPPADTTEAEQADEDGWSR